MSPRPTRGFTLIELMIVVAVIGILAAVAAPKYSNLLRKSRDATTKGNLGSLRSAISIYSADTDGTFPFDHLECLLVERKYLTEIPPSLAETHHPKSTQVGNTEDFASAIESEDTGYWLYFDDANLETPGSRKKGEIWVGCTHTSAEDRTWLSY